jgi:hypothetical protein
MRFSQEELAGAQAISTLFASAQSATRRQRLVVQP